MTLTFGHKKTNSSLRPPISLLMALAAVPRGAGRPGHLLPHCVTGQAARRHTQSQGQTRPRGHVLESNAVLPPAAEVAASLSFSLPRSDCGDCVEAGGGQSGGEGARLLDSSATSQPGTHLQTGPQQL